MKKIISAQLSPPAQSTSLAAMSVRAPSQYAQPSRKNKRAWRKNVDITQVEEGLEQLRKEKILFGAPLDAVNPERLFAVDTTASAAGVAKVGKRLKVDEILAQRSAIPALESRKRAQEDEDVRAAAWKKGKVQGISYKELGRLLRVAGRGDSDARSSLAGLESNGHIVKELYDVWDGPADNSAKTVSRSDKVRSTAVMKTPTDAPSKRSLTQNADAIRLAQTSSFAVAQKPPPTLSLPRISFRENAAAVPVPKEGISYNPTVESWQAVLKVEHKKLHKLDKERKREEERQERIEQLGELLDERARLGLDEVQSDEEEEVKDEEKDTTQIKIEATESTAIPNDVQQVIEVGDEPKSNNSKSSVRKHRLGKYRVAERPLEVKLSDELTDSLRLLKPEGNLSKDRFISLQERGIIESRVQVMKGRKYKKKLTEKWSYKDIK
ncbi:ribosome biogenesis protein Nop53/GLTSCR2 [Limtongia smithiae]|uniref:ribosome biogenesis protein Nop53/GLTSCR2 n=1 Tax=Limtongia smithiae TaxID=1125753 RepID=UPI0034CF0DEE